MKVSIVVADGCVVVDGVAFSGLDLSSMPQGVHAVQWSGSSGHVEVIEQNTNTPTNTSLSAFSEYQWALDVWAQAKNAFDVAEAARLAQEEAEHLEEQERIARQDADNLAAESSTQIDGLRREAYGMESDPLFFKWQRGETTQQAWLDKVAEIKARHPEPAQTDANAG